MQKQAKGAPAGAVRTDGSEFFEKHVGRTLRKNGATTIEFSGPFSIRLEKSDHPVIEKNGGGVYAGVIRGGKGLFSLQRNGAREFGEKICAALEQKTGIAGFLDTANLAAYGFPEGDAESARKQVGAGENDAVVIIAARKKQAATQAFEVLAEEIMTHAPK